MLSVIIIYFYFVIVITVSCKVAIFFLMFALVGSVNPDFLGEFWGELYFDKYNSCSFRNIFKTHLTVENRRKSILLLTFIFYFNFFLTNGIHSLPNLTFVKSAITFCCLACLERCLVEFADHAFLASKKCALVILNVMLFT